jgi:hypothetical protein
VASPTPQIDQRNVDLDSSTSTSTSTSMALLIVDLLDRRAGLARGTWRSSLRAACGRLRSGQVLALASQDLAPSLALGGAARVAGGGFRPRVPDLAAGPGLGSRCLGPCATLGVDLRFDVAALAGDPPLRLAAAILDLVQAALLPAASARIRSQDASHVVGRSRAGQPRIDTGSTGGCLANIAAGTDLRACQGDCRTGRVGLCGGTRDVERSPALVDSGRGKWRAHR